MGNWEFYPFFFVIAMYIFIFNKMTWNVKRFKQMVQMYSTYLLHKFICSKNFLSTILAKSSIDWIKNLRSIKKNDLMLLNTGEYRHQVVTCRMHVLCGSWKLFLYIVIQLSLSTPVKVDFIKSVFLLRIIMVNMNNGNGKYNP